MSKIYFGVDIGGTEIKFGAFDGYGELQEKWSVSTDLTDGGSRIIPQAAQSVKNYLEEKGIFVSEVGGIGMGIPGPVDKNGYVEKCVNLHWTEFSPVKELKKYFPEVRIAAGNDANVAALGEYHRGAGKKFESMMLVTLGTGVGGGVILDGRILLGAHGLCGEVGHIQGGVPETEHCNCGNVGCIDQFASATGIVRIMKKLLRESDEHSCLRGKTELDARKVCDAAKQGDGLARKCIDVCMGALGTGLAYFSHAIDPELYVIGGGVSQAGELILDAVKKEYSRHLFLTDKGAEFALAVLGNDAGITGACMLVTENQ